MSLQCGRAKHIGRCVPIAVALCLTATAGAAAPGFRAILGGSGQDYAAAVASDPQGNTYVAGLTYSPDFKVTPSAFQTKLGGTSDAFVAKFAPDGSLLWSTYLGGILDDWATGVAVDSAGNVIVSGWTRSTDFPVFHAMQGTLNNGASPARYDAFVAKLDPNGAKLLYSTFLGGSDDDGAYGLALDSSGNAYVTGLVQQAADFTGLKSPASGYGAFVSKLDTQGALVYSFFHPNAIFAGIAGAGIAVDATGSAYVAGSIPGSALSSSVAAFGPLGSTAALVFKISPDGSRKVYETVLGGSAGANAMTIAVDRTGSAYVAGITNSVDFPLVRPLESTFGARSFWKSNDSGASWTPPGEQPFAFLAALVVDPSTLNVLYAATLDGGVFKSADGGATWNKSGKGIAGAQVQSLAIDPLHPQTLFAATPNGVYKTVDGAGNWSLVDSPKTSGSFQVAIDPKNPTIVYWNGGGVTRKSSDGGVTWGTLPFPGTSIQSMVLDPHVSGNITAISTGVIGKGIPFIPSYVYRSTDGGATWVKTDYAPPGFSSVLTIDGSTNPSTVYVDLRARSIDGGATFVPLPASPTSTDNTTAIGVDPAGTLYASVYNTGMFVSRDRGGTWSPIGSPLPPPANYFGSVDSVTSIVPAGASGTLYDIVGNNQTSGFVTKLSPDGSSIVFSTFLNGHASFAPWVTYAAQPGVFATQNWISAIALGPAGNVVVAGGTRSSDFPTASGAQAYNAGRADAFAATIAADGSRLISSTYLGGSLDEGALAVATDAQGNVILAGQTWSLDFPVPGGVQAPAGLGEAFVVKLGPVSPPVITSVVNGASFLPGIETGSWVTIRGSNLANTNPGRTWRDDEVPNGRLPTSLDGVSVTINGRPAFVYYISPTQINVQAPTDTAVGPVSVVVNNNGTLSAPATAQLQPSAPAFFQWGGTDYAIASRFPDYAPLGDPATIPGTVAAKPGDILILWGTGFGATNPATPAGSAVSGAPAVAAGVTVTVGDLPVRVLSAVLTTGSAGLYQVTIQLPSTVPSGSAAVQASVGGVPSPAGIQLFIGR